MLLMMGLSAMGDSQLLLFVGLQAAILLGIVVLVLRRNPLGPIALSLQSLLERLAELGARSEHLETDMRAGVQEIRTELASGMVQSRMDAMQSSDQMRRDASDLREQLTHKVETIATEARDRHVVLLESLNAKLTAISDVLASGQVAQSGETVKMKETVEATLSQLGRDLRENTNHLTEEVRGRLTDVAGQMTALSEANERRQEGLRQTVEGKLETLQQSNTSKLEEMRATVDEKLHATLEARLTQSFGLVAERLENVQAGLGEMKDLAVGVGDLKRVLTNVRARGSLGETQCGAQLDQILSPDQYIRNAVIKEGTREAVEFAIRVPNGDQPEMLLPIDVKFPKEDWERLEEAMDHGSADEIAAARKSLAATVRGEAKKICDKYIDPPRTTPFALMYLPTEGLFAEVIRVPGLIDELQSHFHVSVAGPTNFVAILNSLQMGFRTVAIQKKGAEVWRVLAATRNEFQKFGKLMAKVENQVSTVQNTLKDISSKTRTINRTLKDVSTLETQPAEVSGLLGIHEQQALPLGTEREEPELILEMAAEEEQVPEG
ncbi:MAG: DNA recombination protein RmuC [Acidobacteriota bacterium]